MFYTAAAARHFDDLRLSVRLLRKRPRVRLSVCPILRVRECVAVCLPGCVLRRRTFNIRGKCTWH